MMPQNQAILTKVYTYNHELYISQSAARVRACIYVLTHAFE